MSRVCVLPATVRVRLKYGPCRASGWSWQGQPGRWHLTVRSVSEPRRMGTGSANCEVRRARIVAAEAVECCITIAYSYSHCNINRILSAGPHRDLVVSLC